MKLEEYKAICWRGLAGQPYAEQAGGPSSVSSGSDAPSSSQPSRAHAESGLGRSEWVAAVLSNRKAIASDPSPSPLSLRRHLALLSRDQQVALLQLVTLSDLGDSSFLAPKRWSAPPPGSTAAPKIQEWKCRFCDYCPLLMWRESAISLASNPRFPAEPLPKSVPPSDIVMHILFDCQG